MNQFVRLVQSLESSKYLAAAKRSNNFVVTNLLKNGMLCSEQLKEHWESTHFLDRNSSTIFVKDDSMTPVDWANRFDFINTNQFMQNFKKLQKELRNAQYPILMKTVQNMDRVASVRDNDFIHLNNRRKYLMSDLFVHPNQGLEKFNNSQRECKIWWMRFNANPNRFYLDPYVKNSESEAIPTGSQSVTIKIKLPFANLEVERITFVPLNKVELKGQPFPLKDLDARNGIPTVVRSVIDLPAATCAVLFDCLDYENKNTLILNKKLAPYQCCVACLHDGTKSSELEDLCSHITISLQRSGLRMYDKITIFTNCQKEFDTAMEEADCIGIPYTIIVNEITLQNGLLKLRNRDTTLEETIHISDLPAYIENLLKV